MATKLERIVALVSDINRGTYPTVQDLCAKYEIADRTFHDDIGFIRDRMCIEIVFDRLKGGYYNSTPDRKLPDFDISENELLALTLGKDLLVEHSGPAFRLHAICVANSAGSMSPYPAWKRTGVCAKV